MYIIIIYYKKYAIIVYQYIYKKLKCKFVVIYKNIHIIHTYEYYIYLYISIHTVIYIYLILKFCLNIINN